jgi:hypothetical protein
LHSKTHKLIYSIWNEDELPEQWKESIIASVYENDRKFCCSNYLYWRYNPVWVLAPSIVS